MRAKRLNYLARMRRGSNNRETPKGVPSSKNNRQLVTCRPIRDSCMRTKPNSYRHGSYRLGRVYRQGSKTLFHAYGPRSAVRCPPGPLSPQARCPLSPRSVIPQAHCPQVWCPLSPTRPTVPPPSPLRRSRNHTKQSRKWRTSIEARAKINGNVFTSRRKYGFL